MHRVARWMIGLALVGCQSDFGVAEKVDDEDGPVDTDVGTVLPSPDLTITPASLDFGALAVSCDEALALTLSNDGDAPLTLQSFSVEGADRDAFALEHTLVLPLTLPPGGAVDVPVRFTAMDADPRDDARFVVQSDDPDEGIAKAELDGASADPTRHEAALVQPQPVPVDLLWVIDWSPSMDTELEVLAANFEDFIDDFVDLGLDYQIAVTGAQSSCGQSQGPWLTDEMVPADVVDDFVAQTTASWPYGTPCSTTPEQGFGGTSAFIGSNPDFLRTDANFAVAVVADEADQTITTVTLFANWLKSLKGGQMSRVSFSGVVGPAIGNPFGNACPLGSPAEANAFPAPRYHAAIQRTGGVVGDLCSFEFGNFLRHLAYTASGLSFKLALSPEPADPATIEVTDADGNVIPEDPDDGWTWNGNTGEIVLHGDAIPEPGETVVATWDADAACD